MKKEKFINSFKFKVLLLVILIITISSALTYAYFVIEIRQTGTSDISSLKCFDLSFTDSNSINLSNALTMTDEEGLKTKPYTFTLTNNCDTEVNYYVILNVKNNSLQSGFISFSLNDSEPKILGKTQLNEQFEKTPGFDNSYIIHKGSLSKNEPLENNLKIWINDIPSIKSLKGQTWEGQIKVISVVKEVDDNMTLKTIADKTLENLNLSSKTETSNFNNLSPAPYSLKINTKYTNFTNITNDETYPFTESDGTYTSANKADGSSSNITFSLQEDFTGLLCYEISSESNYDKATISIDDNQKAEVSGEKSDCINIGTLTPGNVVKVTYSKDSSVSNGKDEVSFYLTNDYSNDFLYENETGIYTTQDDYGTSYYFRGNPENNYVKFAGFYWRIIRINGDGSLRIIYDGTTPHTNGDNSSDRLAITNTTWSSSSNDNKYLGYMYGSSVSSKRILPGTIDYLDSNNSIYNETNSNIKNKLEEWYNTNIVTLGYDEFVSDTLFCNDRSIPGKDTTNLSWDTGLGYETNYTAFGPGNRLMDVNSYSTKENPTPSLMCNENDAFTKEDRSYGNGANKQKVGLITADEIVLAGGVYNTTNTGFYLYKGTSYWTSSPAFYRGSASIFTLGYNGNMSYSSSSSSNSIAPVINLTPEYVAAFVGDGTLNNPFQTKTS